MNDFEVVKKEEEKVTLWTWAKQKAADIKDWVEEHSEEIVGVVAIVGGVAYGAFLGGMIGEADGYTKGYNTAKKQKTLTGFDFTSGTRDGKTDVYLATQTADGAVSFAKLDDDHKRDFENALKASSTPDDKE